MNNPPLLICTPYVSVITLEIILHHLSPPSRLNLPWHPSRREDRHCRRFAAAAAAAELYIFYTDHDANERKSSLCDLTFWQATLRRRPREEEEEYFPIGYEKQ